MVAEKILAVGVIGVGGVGKCFLDQLEQLAQHYRQKKSHVEVRLVFVSTSRKAVYGSNYAGLPYTDLPRVLADSQQPFLDLPKVVQFLASAPGRAVLVDNTSSQDVANAYPEFLAKGISICTPNKKAFSGSSTLWQDIFTAASSSGAMVYHESSVGAGLPIISTLKELVETGDTIIRIEGVFSGTMSFLFNSFAPSAGSGGKWSAEVKKAQQMGFTEPDPRDDLNGLDVARKLLILARLAGLQLESTSSFPVQSLIPEELESAESGTEFLERLSEFDLQMEHLKASAEKDGKLVRFVGSINVASKEVKVGLQNVERSHPIAGLKGSDNIISFYTERYGARPITVQGAGAGGAVTAMGVTGDLIKVLERSF